MNNKETQISNMSYTNKDFNSIYSELLDTAKNLTNKWDPSQSNESDPGVVLIKENAIIGDKNNYNIDKNVLELFPLSVTQVGNARKIYDFAGYQMHWYRAASTYISVKYTGKFENITSFSIPMWYAFTNDDSSIVYTHVPSEYEDASSNENLVTESDRTARVYCLQGVLQTYDVNGDTLIRFNNLDSQRRLFFTYTNVAENGIFIKIPNGDWWRRVDNLESYAPNSFIYKFGVLPNSNTCYIQFPDDIQYIIGQGLEIKYLTTLGESGNVNANVIDSLYSDGKIDDVSLVDNCKIANINATSDGADPEDLDSAYENYKKIVGTFDTLVTCRDYENALYRSEEVSNCVVSDRTNDLFGTYNVMKSDGMTSRHVNDVLKREDTKTFSGSSLLLDSKSLITGINPGSISGTYDVTVDELALTAYDIVLRLLKPVSSVTDSISYNQTFTKVDDDESYIGESVTEEYKSCQHDFMNPVDVMQPDADAVSYNLPYIFKNYYTVRGTLLTYTKVGTEEIKEIEANARKALFNRFNAREVNFGESIRYEDVVETLENSDTRIKSVTLNEDLSYVLRGLSAQSGDSGEKPFYDNISADVKIEALVKMILRGNIPLYDFNKDCTLQYGETNATVYPTNDTREIRSITTSTAITGRSANGKVSFEVTDDNRNIVIFTPNYVDKTVYTYYTKVINNTGVNIEFDVDTTLVGDGLSCEWKDEDGVKHSISIAAGTTVKLSGYDVVKGDKGIVDDEEVFKALDGEGHPGQIDLQASGKLIIREKNEKPLVDSNDNNLRFIFFTNNYTYDESKYTFTLFEAGEGERVLGVDEYFMYTNSNFDELVILGSGTKISRPNTNIAQSVSYTTSMQLTKILDDGMQAINDLDWQLLPYTLTATELKIVTLGNGSKLDIENDNSFQDDPPKLTSDYHTFGANAKLTYTDNNGVQGTLEASTDDSIIGFARLNLNLSQAKSQTLDGDDSVTLVYDDDTNTSLSSVSIKANRPTAITGGKNISALVTYISETAGIKNEYDLEIISFSKEDISPEPDANNSVIKSDGDSGFSVNTQGESGTTTVKLPLSNTYYSWFKVQFLGDVYTDAKVTDSNDNIIANINNSNAVVICTQDSEVNLIIPKDFTVYIGKLYVTKDKNITSTNTDLSREVRGTLNAIGGTSYTKFGDKYDDLVALYSFDELYQVLDIDRIDLSLLVEDSEGDYDVFQPMAMWDTNHIWNRFTISQLDTSSSTIQVARSSRK